MDDEALSQLIWLASVAFTGGMIGYFHKQYPKDADKNFREKLYSWCLSIATSMFIAYLAYELALSTGIKENMAVALGGLAGFTGTDMLLASEKIILSWLGRQSEK